MTDFFISYSHQDAADYSQQLSNALTKAGYKVFIDKADLTVGDHLPSRIADELKRARYFVALISPAHAESKRAQRELESAATSNLRILPVRLHNAVMPEVLQNRIYIDAGDSVDNATTFLTKAAQDDLSRLRKRRVRVVSEFLPVVASILGVAAVLSTSFLSTSFTSPNPIALEMVTVISAGVIVFISFVALIVLGASKLRGRPKPVDVLKEEVRDAYVNALEASSINPFSTREHQNE